VTSLPRSVGGLATVTCHYFCTPNLTPASNFHVNLDLGSKYSNTSILYSNTPSGVCEVMSSAQVREGDAPFRAPSRTSRQASQSTPDSHLEPAQYRISASGEERVVAASPKSAKCSIQYFERMAIDFAHCIGRALASDHDLVRALLNTPL
jgi:hypothetical protein